MPATTTNIKRAQSPPAWIGLKSSTSTSWADMVEEDEEEERQAQAKFAKCPAQETHIEKKLRGTWAYMVEEDEEEERRAESVKCPAQIMNIDKTTSTPLANKEENARLAAIMATAKALQDVGDEAYRQQKAEKKTWRKREMANVKALETTKSEKNKRRRNKKRAAKQAQKKKEEQGELEQKQQEEQGQPTEQELSSLISNDEIRKRTIQPPQQEPSSVTSNTEDKKITIQPSEAEVQAVEIQDVEVLEELDTVIGPIVVHGFQEDEQEERINHDLVFWLGIVLIVLWIVYDCVIPVFSDVEG